MAQYDDEDPTQKGPMDLIDAIGSLFGPPRPGDEDYVPPPIIETTGVSVPDTEPAPPKNPPIMRPSSLARPPQEEICLAAVALVRAAERGDQEGYDRAFLRLTEAVTPGPERKVSQ